ncbi:hypothetical protein B0H14DRAFT_3058473 [Mycena olivaceomarginata]|nr:hypothetical protein B0H14DRAFT_3058473 [Mycena olivaceomarginata]
MGGLPDVLRVPDGPEKLSLPPTNLPVSNLIKFQLPPQHKSTVFADPTDYLLDLGPTITTFDVLEIPVPPSVVFKALGRAILLDPEIKSIALVHSPLHRDKGGRVREARTLWRTTVKRVDTMLEKLTLLADAAGRAKTALEALEKLPWEGTIQGFRGGPSIDNLACWFTTKWLNTDHEDQMLELLAADLGLSDGSVF